MAYIFDEWNPNPVLLIMSMISFVITIYFATRGVSVLVLVTILLFGWSFSFSKKKKVRNSKQGRKK